MPLIFKECACGRGFEAKHPTRVYCDECRQARLKEQNRAAKKRYLQTDKGKAKHSENSKATYYRHREERCARARAYHAAHREELKARMRARHAETYEIRCLHCKELFDRVSSERICQPCQAKAEEKRKKKRADEARARYQAKRAAKRPPEVKNAPPPIILKPTLPTEADKLAMLRAAIRKHRAAA